MPARRLLDVRVLPFLVLEELYGEAAPSVDREPEAKQVRCRSLDTQPESVGDLFRLTVQ
jgi:hypothetical protein